MKEKPSPRVRKFDTTQKFLVNRLSALTYNAPLTVPSTYLTAYPVKGIEQEIVDTPHNWPARKGTYEGGNLTLTRNRHVECQEEEIYFPSNALHQWGPTKMSGHIVKLLDNTGYYGETPAWVKSDGDVMKLEVINRVFSKAYSSKATLIVTAAELHKTVGMVKTPFGQARNLLDQMTRRYRSLLKRGVDATSAASKAWLEYRMGWKPVLYDLSNIAKAVKIQLTKTDFEYDRTYRSHIDQQWSGAGSKDSSGWAFSKLGWTTAYSAKHSAGVIIRENLFEEQSRPWQQIFGVQLHDVAPAVWELMPYSFVVDRFLDVQTWLEAIQPRPNTKVMFSWQTTTERSDESVHVEDWWIMLAGITRQDPDSLPSSTQKLEMTKVTRAVGVTPSIFPVFNSRDLNLQQHADHAALLIGQLVGLFPEVKNRNFGREFKRPFIKR